MNFAPAVLGGLASLVAAGLAAPLVMKSLVALKSRQTISQFIEEHQHKQGTPTMGGIIVLIGLLVGCFVGFSQEIIPYIVLTLAFGFVGLADDYIVPKLKPGSRGLHWIPKLLLEIVAVLVSCWVVGLRDPLAIGVITFLVLFMSNAYNFSDGLDSLAGGLGVILCVGFAALALVMGVGMGGGVLVAMAALGLGFLPFLFYNAPPARVFMGDVGALPIGAVFGWAMAMLLFPQGVAVGPELFALQSPLWPLIIICFVMFVEIIPVPLQILSVKLRKKRLFNFKTPVHHAFQEKKWPETRIVWMFHLVQWVSVFLALAWVVLTRGGTGG